MSRDGFGVLDATALDKRTLVRCRVRAVASFAVLLAASLLPARAAAERMKLLTRDTGWVADTHSLYWTSDGGADWADITPVVPGVGPEGLTLHSVFFLDTSQGWLVISHDERVAASTFQEFIRPKTVYGIARTGDGR